MSDAQRSISLSVPYGYPLGLLGSRRRPGDNQSPAVGLSRRLTRKYVLMLIGLVSLMLLVNAGLHF